MKITKSYVILGLASFFIISIPSSNTFAQGVLLSGAEKYSPQNVNTVTRENSTRWANSTRFSEKQRRVVGCNREELERVEYSSPNKSFALILVNPVGEN